MTAAPPDTPAAFADYLGTFASGDVTDLQKALADDSDGGFAKQVAGYMRAEIDRKTTDMRDIADAVTAEAQKAAAALVKNGHAKRLDLRASTPALPGGKRAQGSGLNGIFGDFTEYLHALHNETNENRTPTAQQREQYGKLMAYQEKVPADGGFLVPEEFRTEILQVALERAVVRPRARVIPMNALKLSFPAIDETSHASTIMGGILAYRTEEAQALVESGGKFKKVTLDLTKQTLFSNVSNELILDTGGAMDGFVRASFGAAAAWFEDVDFLNGSGAGEPLGVLRVTNPGTITAGAVSGQGAGTIVWENVLAMYARMLPSSLGSAVWVVGPDVFPQLATMGLVVGTGGSAVWMPDAHGAPQMTLLGRPIVISEKVPGAVGTQGDITLVDFGYYLIGDGMRMRIESSTDYRFGNDQTSYRLVQRNDGRPWMTSPLTPRNGSATLAPVVQLSSTRT